MSRTAMGIDHLEATGQPDPNTPGGQLPVPLEFVGRWTKAPLGFIHCEPASQVPLQVGPGPAFPALGLTGSGDQEWIYIYHPADATNPLAAGDVCVRAGLFPATGNGAAYADHSPGVATSGASVIGVAQYAIPVGFFGFILRKGPGAITYDAAAGGGLPLITSATTVGEAAVGAATAAGFGASITQVGAGIGGAILNCTG